MAIDPGSLQTGLQRSVFTLFNDWINESTASAINPHSDIVAVLQVDGWFPHETHAFWRS